MKLKTRLIIAWVSGLGIMFILYFLGNPFGIYDDILILAGPRLVAVSIADLEE